MRGQETKLKEKGENGAHLIQLLKKQRNLSHAVDRGAQRKLRQQQKKLKEEEAKLRPLRKEFHLKHGFPLGADEGEEHQVPNPGRSPNQRLITSLRRRSSMMLGSQPCSVFC